MHLVSWPLLSDPLSAHVALVVESRGSVNLLQIGSSACYSHLDYHG